MIGHNIGAMPIPDPLVSLQGKMQPARVVLVTSLWKTQLWYPIVLELLGDYPVTLLTLPDTCSIQYLENSAVCHHELS